MATYNGEKYLREQLDSIAAQTRLPDELVICDDQSTDGTESIVKEFANCSLFPIKFNRNVSRLQFASNFLSAATLCQGDYIMFCDQDDIWFPTKVEEVAQAADQTGACLIAHDAVVFGDVQRPSGITAHATEDGRIDGSSLSAWNFFPGFVCTFRRDLLDICPAEARPIDLIESERMLAHDRWVCFLTSLAGDAFLIKSPLVHYRQHANNASGGMRKRKKMLQKLMTARLRFGYHLYKNHRVAQRCKEIAEGYLTSLGVEPAEYSRPREQLGLLNAVESSYAYRMQIAFERSRIRRLQKIFSAMRSDVYSKSATGIRRFRLVGVDVILSVLAARDQAISLPNSWES